MLYYINVILSMLFIITSSVPILAQSIPTHIATSEQEARLSWTLFQNSSNTQFTSMGIGDYGCPVDNQGNESAFPESVVSYSKYCLSSSYIVLTEELEGERLYSYALISDVEARAHSGKYVTRETKSCGADCSITTITTHAWEAKGNIYVRTTQVVPRLGTPIWLTILAPQKSHGYKKPWDSYRINIFNHQTGKILLSWPIDDSTLDSTARLGNKYMIRKLTDLVPDDPSGVPEGQSFRLELIIQGNFETDPKNLSLEERFGASVVWGVYTK